ncbi:DUF3606 domain-containing protein [Pedobacter sp. Du54]|uniref:DUF3606 domain-containing protein n=1 Tax=Pedobacter anseongensis TaxID=3133439 RepID=UPI00309FA554
MSGIIFGYFPLSFFALGRTFFFLGCFAFMEENKDNFGFSEHIPDSQQIKQRFPINDDSDTLEPFDDASEDRVINADDPFDLTHWANEFQVSEDDLKAAIVLNGTSVRSIKKYLSV